MNDDILFVDDVPVAPRTLRDGRQFDVVKVYWDPNQLEARLRSLDWQVAVRRVGDTFLYGSGSTRRRRGCPEGAEHHRYAVRDLAVLEART